MTAMVSDMLLAIFGTFAALFIVHRRQRDDEREKRMQYWREQVCYFFSVASSIHQLCLQNAFRQNIMNMRQSARDSILSLPRNGSNRSTMYSHDGTEEGSQSPNIGNIHAATKASGLRQQYYDDNSTEYDDGMPAGGQGQDGRF